MSEINPTSRIQRPIPPIPSRQDDPIFGIEQILFHRHPDIYAISKDPKVKKCAQSLNILKHIYPVLSEDQQYLAKEKLFSIERKLRDDIDLEDLQEDLRLLIDDMREQRIPESPMIRIEIIKSYCFPDTEIANVEEMEAFERKIEEIDPKNLSGPQKAAFNRTLDDIIKTFEEKKPVLDIEIMSALNSAISNIKSLTINKRDGRNP